VLSPVTCCNDGFDDVKKPYVTEGQRTYQVIRLKDWFLRRTMSNAVAVPSVLSISEAASFLNSTPHFVRLLIRRGKLPYQRIGKRFVVARASLESYLSANWRREGVAA
jgi:excisionase family DNA binding protein